MAILSSPISQLKPHYDVLVIGSGYGGSIAASLLARARKSDGSALRVCLLERGKEIPVGRFPSDPEQAAKEFQVNAEGKQVGKEDALYWLHAGHDISVFQGCGLGGTSLVNANVALPPEPRVWSDARWPRELIADLEDGVQKGFERARHMLGSKPYPGKPALKKYQALEQSAKRLGASVYHPPINVSFEAGLNAAGVHQPKCDQCGDCVSGCNKGSKNTLMMNYLPDAKNHGAEIFCSVRVSHVSPSGQGWRVYFQPIGVHRECFHAEAMFVEAGTVILSAGALGSTEILLRSKQRGLACSATVGDHFTGNGDVLGFAYNNDVAVNGIGSGARSVPENEGTGPCITGIIDCRDTDREEQAFVIEEGVIPGAIAPLVAKPLRLVADLTGFDTDPGVWDGIKEQARVWSSVLPGGEHFGAMHNTQTFLVMARDNASGHVRLEGANPTLSWPGVGSGEQFMYLQSRLIEATTALGGTYVPSPMFNRAFDYGLITVHPLGGCSMADDAARGATNHKGQVFAGGSGTAVHSSLYVSDGAILPCAVGVNPLLTISAIAERNTRLLAKDAGWSIDDTPARGPVLYDGKPDARPTKVLRFTEKMAGYISRSRLGDDEYAAASADGEKNASPCHFVLSISSTNPEEFLGAADHPAVIVGTVYAPALSSQALTVSGGVFNLFVADPGNPKSQRMRYRMELRSVEGKTFYFDGFKLIRDEAGIDVWDDTTTLYITLREGHDETGTKVAQGILKIKPEDFAVQLTTTEALDDEGHPLPLMVARFGQLFARNLFTVYGKV
ncbi:MAG TPA: GMC family oxidoreductase N-terminal domain-containing protein [Polyangiaceae bacterium]|nr:GMC family oxidoreductase N-terminal domain-containing protein [Polyangiaceae bacterium]